MKKSICILLSVIVVICSLVACSVQQPEEETTTTETTTTTTTETTTVTTTENLKTTFPATVTRKIYKGLEKDDTEGAYPYKLATYTTYYNTSDKTRTVNLQNAVEKVNNIVIPKGGKFSFNQTVGKRTVTAGYETAKIVRGTEFVDGLGGGVCQVSSTIFECVLRANVEILERSPHTLKVAYVPLGGDATVQWNTQDLKWQNTTGTALRLKMHCDSGTLTCSVYGKRDIDIGDVDISITHSGKYYTLTRTVNGHQNYRTVSSYKEQTTTTTKAAKTTKKPKKKGD